MISRKSFNAFTIISFLAVNSIFANSTIDSVKYRTAYAYDTLFPTYCQNGSEVPERVKWINQRLTEAGILNTIVPVTPIDSPMQWIKKVHTQKHINGIRSYPVDTLNGATRTIGEIADVAVAYALGAVKLVMDGKADNAFANIRPPGHHVANDGYTVGFCAYANVVIAAKYAREMFNINRILIVDWDYHYGNGTESFICNDTNIFMAEFSSDNTRPFCDSLKRHIVTYNVGYGTNSDYVNIFTDSLIPAMDKFKPELILISCGFDLKAKDALGSYSVTAQGISTLTKIVMDIASKHCNGRIVSLLEGGYYDRGSSPQTWYGLSQCAENHVRTLMTSEIQEETAFFKPAAVNPFSLKLHSQTMKIMSPNTVLFDISGRRVGLTQSGKMVFKGKQSAGVCIARTKDGLKRVIYPGN
jgi:acetoin utilization deacetylase AcuC-like enzyme